MAKRKRSTAVQQVTPAVETPVPLPPQYNIIPNGSRVAEERVAKVTEDSSISVKAAKTKVKAVTNGRGSRASLVASKEEVKVAVNRHALSTVATSHVHDTAQGSGEAADDDPGSPLSELSDAQTPKKPVSTQATSARTGPSENAAKENSSSKGKRSPKVKKESKPEQEYSDPEAEDDEVPSAADEIAAALSRPPPVHSDYLPLPWKGRLGYVSNIQYLLKGDKHLVFPSGVPLLTRQIGMSLHLSSILEPSCILVSNLSNRFNYGAPASLERS